MIGRSSGDYRGKMVLALVMTRRAGGFSLHPQHVIQLPLPDYSLHQEQKMIKLGLEDITVRIKRLKTMS